MIRKIMRTKLIGGVEVVHLFFLGVMTYLIAQGLHHGAEAYSIWMRNIGG